MSQQKEIGWLKRFAWDRPVIFSALVLVVAILLTEIPLRVVLMPWLGDPGGELLEGIVEQGLVGLLLIWLLVRLGLFTRARFTPPRQWKALWLVWPLAVMALLNIWPLLDGSWVLDTSRPGLIVLCLGLVLSVGFFEEILGRGLVLTVMLEKWGSTRRGVYQAVLVSSALFGVGHIVNVIMGQLPLLSNLTQLLYGFFFAVILAACFLRNNSIWPAIVMHAAVDLSLLREVIVGGAGSVAVANNTGMEALTTLLLTLPLLLYGLFILRKVGSP